MEATHEPNCIEERAKHALADCRSRIMDAQFAMEDWRGIYAQRGFISKRSGDKEGAVLADHCWYRINSLINRSITILSKIEQLQKLFDEVEKEVNG